MRPVARPEATLGIARGQRLVVGAIVIIALENKLGDLGNGLARLTSIEWFNTLGDSVTIVTGLIFIICVLAFRRGIVGEIAARIRPASRH